MTLRDAEEIAMEVRKYDRKLMIGLNRRFSPLAGKIKELLTKTDGPLVINYRWINEAWDAEWPFDPVQGGGKLVSSGCHMLDFVMFLLNDTPESVSADLKTLVKKEIKTHDTASLRLDFKSGSIVNICTSELGATSYPQEKMEIFTRHGVIVMDDFKALSFYGINTADIHLEQQNKGILEEMREFAAYLNNKKGSPCGVEAGINVARCTAACLKSAELNQKIMLNDIK